MSRLVNADDIPYAVNIDHPSGEYDFAYRCEIDAMPTVEAIPIEYMQAQVDCGKWQEIIQRWREHETD